MSELKYTPQPLGDVPLSELIAYVYRELLTLSDTFSGLDLLNLQPTTTPPAKAAEGDIRLADGTGWNPGAGAGVYCYYGGAWNKLG